MTSTLVLIGQSPLLELGMETFSHHLQATVVSSYHSLDDFIDDEARASVGIVWLDFISPVEDVEHLMSQVKAVCTLNPDYRILIFCRNHFLNELNALSKYQQVSLISNQESVVAMEAYTSLAMKGERVISPKISEEIYKFRTIRETLRFSLTQNEINVLEKLCNGMDFRIISRLSGQDIKTVSAHKRSAMKKLGARNDIELFDLRNRYFSDINFRLF
ncbi:helix-turn-helix domain-containing protein [Rahnella victoriana]|uniref:helix-turn-helix domain-containing protein n=1 Tax=Rahnella victoriana TaxID=1510570 RepID=UPI001E63728A|nr:LuxR C-terminal-related transcriptional regulator [Rahnella victoriana]UHM93651.1 LuxR C-terminal-related transcriptional regulator [Rahnella victoriana]